MPCLVSCIGSRHQLYYRAPARPCAAFLGRLFDLGQPIRIVIDDPSSIAPDVHIYTRSKLGWVTVPASVPAFDEYYDSKQLWPAESLERLAAVRARADAS